MDEETKSPWDSQTIKAAVSAIVINVLTLVALFTGRQFDLGMVQFWLDTVLPILVNMASAWLGWKAIKGRMNATQPIAKGNPNA